LSVTEFYEWQAYFEMKRKAEEEQAKKAKAKR